MLRNGDGGRWVVLSERYGEPGETIQYDQSAVWIPDGSVSADTDSLRQSGVSADTVLTPSVGSPMVSEAQ